MAQTDQTEQRLSEQLSQLVLAIETTGQAILPSSNTPLLHSIVEAAARIFGAAAASIALINENDQTLEFKVAVGDHVDNVLGRSVPLNRGIAGYVAMTGQPIAVSDVLRDARFNQEFAESTGYLPRSILATPLLLGERVIGVMEVLDKIDAASFNLQDMETLGLFANQAALAINQFQQVEQLEEALVLGLKRLVSANLPAGADELVESLQRSDGNDTQAEDLLALAELFREIGALGEAERRLALKILEAFKDYSRSRSRLQR
jgi:GAF domain-containing protein